VVPASILAMSRISLMMLRSWLPLS